jgi:hypothetical protein
MQMLIRAQWPRLQLYRIGGRRPCAAPGVDARKAGLCADVGGRATVSAKMQSNIVWCLDVARRAAAVLCDASGCSNGGWCHCCCGCTSRIRCGFVDPGRSHLPCRVVGACSIASLPTVFSPCRTPFLVNRCFCCPGAARGGQYSAWHLRRTCVGSVGAGHRSQCAGE